MMYGMARMNYSDQIKAIAKVFEKRTQKLKAMPQEEAKMVARESLIRIGLIDDSGNLAAPYVAMHERYSESASKADTNTDGMAKGTLVGEPAHPPKRKSIKELFAGYTGTYKSQEIDWGESVGKETEV